MKKNLTAKSKILSQAVIGIAIYLAVNVACILVLSQSVDKLPYGAYTVDAIAKVLSGTAALIYICTDKTTPIFRDKQARYSGNPLFTLFVIITAFALTVSFNFLFSLIPWDVFGSKNIVQDNDAFYSIPLSFRLISYVVIAPFAEEALFRGVIFTRFRKLMPLWGAAVCSAVIFGIYHGNLMQGLYAFIMGLCMCIIFEFGGSLLCSIIFHMTANLISNLCYEYDYINKVIYSPVGIALSIAYVVVAIILCYVYKQRLTKKDK